MYDEYAEVFHYSTGGNNHQKWEGGYADHIAECLRINRVVYQAMNAYRPLPFSMASADIALFFHDIEKPFKYGPSDHPDVTRWSEFASPSWRSEKELQTAVLADILGRFHITLTDDEKNALQYAHGEGSDHRKDRRVAGPLAAHVHHCDNTSARIWFDDGKGLG
jgi:hypothetical protein